MAGVTRVLRLVVALALGTTLALPAYDGPAAAAGVPAAGGADWSLRQPFTREVVRPGDVDADPWHIEHVYEVQYRLQRLGLFPGRPDGRFGPRTEAAVEAFQRQIGVAATGIVDARTWRPLIEQSLRGRRVVPPGCKDSGWHACYDRRWHQLNLYRDGTLLNSWFVRGGAASTPTRTGRFLVYHRDVDHVSSTFDAPMPWAQFFSGGQALHGSRLMVDPWVGHSHGCVNLWAEDAQQLWNLTSTRRLWVHVYGRWD